jgi:hypothetical protein
MRTFAPLANVNLVALLAVLSRTNTTSGDGVDISAYEGQVGVILNSGIPTGTDKTLDVKIQHSDDDGDTDAYADVEGASFDQVTESVNGIQKMSLDTHGLKKYIRVVATHGTSTTVVYSATLIGKTKVFDES